MADPWRPVSEMVQPVECYWNIVSDEGLATLRLRLDLMQTILTSAEAKQMLERIFKYVWAPLLTVHAQCPSYGTTPFLLTSLPYLFLNPDLKGNRNTTTSPRTRSAVIVAWNGGFGSQCNHRYYIPFMPASWTVGGVLSDEGFSNVLTAMRGIVIGSDNRDSGPGPRLIMWQSPKAATAYEPARDGRWSQVEQLITCAYLEKSPDP